MTNLLSVVLPTHNRAQQVLRAARSVLCQDVPALEVIIVDDASTDDTPRVIDRLATEDRRVRLVSTEAGPVGPCHARNRGLELAQGELVAFCDDDDTWTEEAGPAVLSALEADPGLGAVSGWHRVLHTENGAQALYRGPTSYGASELMWQNFVGVPFGVIRRSTLSFDIGFDPDLPTGEDWDLWLRCAGERKIRTVPTVCYVYRQHGGSRVTAGMAAQIEGRRNFVSKHGAEMSSACRLFHQTILAGYEHGRPAMLRTVLAAGRRTPAQAGLVGMLVATSTAASRAGVRRRDPGLQARIMAAMVKRLAPPDDGADG